VGERGERELGAKLLEERDQRRDAISAALDRSGFE
jgi:hypothetical protein